MPGRVTHSGFELVISHVAADAVRIRHLVLSIERLDIFPIDKEGASFSSELVHVVEVAKGDHRVAIVELVSEAGPAGGQNPSRCLVCDGRVMRASL